MMDGSCSDDSEIEEERAGGGPGPTGQTTSIRNAGGAFNYRMTAETLSVRADIACVIYICTWALRPALNSTNVCCCFTLVSRLDRLFNRQPRL